MAVMVTAVTVRQCGGIITPDRPVRHSGRYPHAIGPAWPEMVEGKINLPLHNFGDSLVVNRLHGSWSRVPVSLDGLSRMDQRVRAEAVGSVYRQRAGSLLSRGWWGPEEFGWPPELCVLGLR